MDMDAARYYAIREGDLRIVNPFSPEKLATLGRAVRLRAGWRLADFCSGRGEMLCTWARDHGITGHGVDISPFSVARARQRAAELGVDVTFAQGDAAVFVAAQPVDVASCIGATWIGNGVAGTIRILERSLKPGGMLLLGEPYWRLDPPDDQTARACHAERRSDFAALPDLLAGFGELGWDVVEMVLSNQDDWDRYRAAEWLSIRRWLDANPDDPMATRMRAELASEPARYVRYQREYLGWGVFALLRRPAGSTGPTG